VEAVFGICHEVSHFDSCNLLLVPLLANQRRLLICHYLTRVMQIGPIKQVPEVGHVSSIHVVGLSLVGFDKAFEV
jgi:hypothetical protein